MIRPGKPDLPARSCSTARLRRRASTGWSTCCGSTPISTAPASKAHLRRRARRDRASSSFPGAFEGTDYFPGHFRCRPDEAVIIEIEDAGLLYWNTALFQMQFENLDWWARSSSFNRAQVAYRGDGKVRFVASWKDPGVPNWLDARAACCT